ncbi:MAG: DNA polymerase I [Vicinamibacterales bacterium]|jgi:DNA polymerase-1|nr:DNA polymerase I [Vicinamibacterales bacterium]HJN42930.1 DNA polymerase I [Vicinamibacterales bacterium]
MSSKPRLFLIDGNNQMYRAYHAIRALTGPDGRSTNAVYGFVTMLRKLIDDQQPDLMAAAFDLRGPTFRHELDADYKATRRPMPDDLVEQVPWVHEACAALGVPVVTHEGVEADDVIGTLATRAIAAGIDVVVVTGDKDFFQLVSDQLRVFNPRDEGTWYDDAGVIEKFGVRPDQVVDVLSLMGDASDNVKGVPGIGEKGARQLVSDFGSLDWLLEHADELPTKKYRTALTEHGDDARRSRDLVTIHTDVPVPSEPDQYRYAGADRARCFTLFSELGFTSLLSQFAPTAESVATDYRIVNEITQLEALAASLREAGHCGLHVLTVSGPPSPSGVVGLAFSTAPRSASYVPLARDGLDLTGSLDGATVFETLGPLLEDPQVGKIGHDLKREMLWLAASAVRLRGLELDTMIASYLLDSTRTTPTLETVALEHAGYQALTAQAVRGKGPKAPDFDRLPPDGVVAYACERADLPLQARDPLAALLREEHLAELYRELEHPLIPVLVDIERAGIQVATDALATQSRQMDGELNELQSQIFSLAGESFNINSPRQLSAILFEKLALPSRKKTGKTRAASTSAQVLSELAEQHELPRLVVEWRAVQKLKGTYVDALPKMVRPDTGRVHTSFNQAVAATGRLSSSDPNLQNIPIRTPLGREIRRAFVAREGHVLISADYSQIELRVLAHLSADPALIDAFVGGEDIHDQTAHRVFGDDSGLDPHELRRRAKIINYALLYGKTAFTLAKDIDVTPHAAQAFIDAYFEGYPSVRGFLEGVVETARETGEVRTMFGRRRLVPELRSRNGQIRAAAERVTVNMPIQGTAADILKRAMIELAGALPASAPMILTVHDELLIEAPGDEADSVASLVRDRMERAADLSVPLTVDVGIGENWMAAKG